MIEQLMERTDPGSAVVDEAALAAVFDTEPRATPAPRPSVPSAVRWAGWGLTAAAVVAGILAVPLAVSSPFTAPVGVGDYPHYATQGELEDAATAVLLVDITAERSGSYEGIPVEVMSATVLGDAAGTHPAGSSIEIKEMPGEDALTVGGRFVVFIVEYDAVPASLVNPEQGAYPVIDGQARPAAGNEVLLDAGLQHRLGLGG